MKSVFDILFLYRNANQIENDKYFDCFANSIKVEDTSDLIFLEEDVTSKAYLKKDNYTIIVINNDGYIDNIIYLFDKFMTTINSDNLVETTKKLLNNYYKTTKSAFIEDLYSLNFISDTLYKLIKKECL